VNENEKSRKIDQTIFHFYECQNQSHFVSIFYFEMWYFLWNNCKLILDLLSFEISPRYFTIDKYNLIIQHSKLHLVTKNYIIWIQFQIMVLTLHSRMPMAKLPFTIAARETQNWDPPVPKFWLKKTPKGHHFWTKTEKRLSNLSNRWMKIGQNSLTPLNKSNLYIFYYLCNLMCLKIK